MYPLSFDKALFKAMTKFLFMKIPNFLKTSFLGFTNLLIAISTLKICRFLTQKKVVYDFVKTNASCKTALRQKAL